MNGPDDQLVIPEWVLAVIGRLVLELEAARRPPTQKERDDGAVT